MCSGSSCKSIDASESGRIKYYLNDYDYEKTKMPLILCNNGSACVRAGGENGTYYLDEDSKSTTGDTYSKVIYCSSNTSNNISCTSTTISNGYVINGADKKKVIKWSGTSCNSIDASESGKIKYYLNVSTYDMSSNPLIQCKNGNDCIMIVALVGFYINDVDGLIKCDSSVLCNIIEGEKGSYYLDEGSRSTIDEVHSKIIYCKSTTSCSNETVNYGYVINGADKIKVIECSGTSYISIDASESNKSKYYLNVSTYDKTTNPLINCDNGDECVTIIALTGYYINAAPDSSDSLKKAVFLCSININGNSECIEVETVSPDSIYINNDDGKLIQCFNYSSSGVNKKGCFPLTDSSILGTDDIPTYFVNAGSDGKSNRIIKCIYSTDPVNNSCSLIGIEKYNVYLNGNLKNENNLYGEDKPLIICKDDETCETTMSNLNSNGYEFFINAGKYITESVVDNRLIICTYTDGNVVCEKYKVDDMEYETFFINGNYKLKDFENYMIKCSSPSDCVLYKNPNANINNDEHYIYGVVDSEHPTDKAIIEVKFSSNTQGQTPNILATAQIKDAAVNDIYINSFNQNLIRCLSNGCFDYENNWNNKRPKYYINAALSFNNNYIELLIKCTSGQKCVLENGESNGNGVYLNSNFEVNGDSEHQLIICYEDKGTNNKKCIPKKVIMESNDSKIFYKNYGEYNDDEDIKYSLIDCYPTVDSGVICDPFKVTLGDGNPSDVFYMNANQDIDKNYLIHCTAVNECIIYSKSNSVVGEDEFYVYGDLKSNDYSECIIKCVVSNTAAGQISVSCDYLNTVAANHIYINSLNGNLIRCNNSNKCLASINIGTCSERIPSFFINGKGTNENGNKKMLIECKGDGKCSEYIPETTETLLKYFIDGDNSNKIITCTVNNCISNIHAKIYDSKKIIICSDENCQLGGESTEAINTYTYYIHGANIKEIIKCSESECNIQNYIYTQGHGYIDGGDDTKKSVIICSKNEGCVSITGNTSLSQVYIQAENDNNLLLIYCAVDNYIYELSNEFSEEECKLIKSETEKKYYIDATNDKNIVNCNSVSFCKSNVSEASSSKIVRKKDGVTSFRTIICKEDGCHSEGKYYLNLIYNKDIQKYINFYIN